MPLVAPGPTRFLNSDTIGVPPVSLLQDMFWPMESRCPKNQMACDGEDWLRACSCPRTKWGGALLSNALSEIE